MASTRAFASVFASRITRRVSKFQMTRGPNLHYPELNPNKSECGGVA
jgi:hypothetical protein